MANLAGGDHGSPAACAYARRRRIRAAAGRPSGRGGKIADSKPVLTLPGCRPAVWREVTESKNRGITCPRRQSQIHPRANRQILAHDGIPDYAAHDEVRANTMMNSATVSAELGLSLVVPEHGTVPLVASLSYCTDDPFAIRMAFHVGADEPVEWIFARDLLAEGLHGPAGEGDVRVWPSDEHGERVLNLALSSPFGAAHFEAPLSDTAAFLQRTFDMIPEGQEAQFVDLDSALDELLWRA